MFFLGREFTGGKIHYVRYDKGDIYAGESQYVSIGDVLERHRVYMEKYISIIEKKIEKILRKLCKSLLELQQVAERNIGFEKLVSFTEQRMPRYFKEEYVFNKQVILTCNQKKDIHRRYSNAIDLFRKGISGYISGIIENIGLLLASPLASKVPDSIKDENQVIEVGYNNVDEKTLEASSRRHYDYEFSKLFERHILYDPIYFKRHFEDQSDIIEELNHLELNVHDNAEYYSSVELLRKIMKDKGFLQRDIYI